MKVFKTLSRYVLDQNGDVFERKSGEQVQPDQKDQVKLVTDEIFTSSITRKKSNLVRRYTREEIVSRFNNKDAVDLDKFKDPDPKPAEPVVVKANIVPKEVHVAKVQYQFEIHGVKYENAKKASEALGVSSNTINNRVKKGVEGYKAI